MITVCFENFQVLLFCFRVSNRYIISGRHNGLNKFGNSRRFPFNNKRMHKNRVSETDSQDQSSANTESRPRKRREVLWTDNEDDDCFIRNLAPFRGTGKKLLLLIIEKVLESKSVKFLI